MLICLSCFLFLREFWHSGLWPSCFATFERPAILEGLSFQWYVGNPVVQYGSTKFLFSAGLDLHGWFQVSSTPAILILFSAICLSTSLLVMGGDGPETPRLYPLQHGCTSLRDVEKVIRGKVMGMPTIVFLPRFRDIIYIHDFLRSILQLFDHEKLTFTTWRHCFGHAKETTWYLAAFELTGGSCHGHLPLAAQHDQVLQKSLLPLSFFFLQILSIQLMDGCRVAHILYRSIGSTYWGPLCWQRFLLQGLPVWYFPSSLCHW